MGRRARANPDCVGNQCWRAPVDREKVFWNDTMTADLLEKQSRNQEMGAVKPISGSKAIAMNIPSFTENTSMDTSALEAAILANHLNAWFGTHQALVEVNLRIPSQSVTAITVSYTHLTLP